VKTVTDRLDKTDPLIRLAASPFVLQEHLLPVFEEVRRGFPGLRFNLKQACPFQIAELFEARKIELALTTLSQPPPPGCQSRVVAQLESVLLVPKSSRYRKAERIWKRKPLTQTLIAPPSHDPISRKFHRELARNHVIWKPDIQLESIDLIETYVLNGLGVGVSVVVPGRTFAPGLRALALPGFPTVDVGVIWQGSLQPAAEAFVNILAERVETGAPVHVPGRPAPS
jgi:DNA-binding transcriptional LysR family regulator